MSDKDNLKNILETLRKYKINIISSGGTYKSIKKLGYSCTEISRYTGFKEMLDGRVKHYIQKFTLGFFMTDRIKVINLKCLNKKFPPIDLIIVNFYPFQKVVTNTKISKDIIENIDIGGPTLVRAAAKNFKNVTIITKKMIIKIL